MSEELQIEGRTYISSKRASQMSGYAQDYIGQLARKSLIDSKRIGGLWYVSMESLETYKKKADEYKPEPPVPSRSEDPAALVSFDGREYVSAARAAQITGYAQDYVGQLARDGKILSRQIGSRWYVDRESILSHKSEKDRLLAAVQRESVGLQTPQKGSVNQASFSTPGRYAGSGPFLNYYSETQDLMPITGKEISHTQRSQGFGEGDDDMPAFAATPTHVNTPTSIPIKRKPVARVERASRYADSAIELPMPKKSGLPLILGAAMTIIIVLSVGYVSVLKQNSAYALGIKRFSSIGSLPASVGAAFNEIGNVLEPYLTHELSYKRSEAE